MLQNICYCNVVLHGDTSSVACMPFGGRDMAIHIHFYTMLHYFYGTVSFAFLVKFLALPQQLASASILAIGLALCFLFWDRRLFAEGRA